MIKRLVTILLILSLASTCVACEKHNHKTTESTGDENQCTTIDAQQAADVPFTPITSVQDYFELDSFTPPEKAGGIHYLFHQPIRDTGKDYPLIIFLHGLGDTVDTQRMGTATQLVDSLMRLENNSEQYSTYTLIPTTPSAAEGWWNDWQLDFLQKLIPNLVENYNIDAKRIYITGISMGGYTTCTLVNTMPPDTFAAAVPLSGAYTLIRPKECFNTAFRIYHSATDTVVDVSRSRNLYQQLLKYEHPNAQYIEYPEGSHISPLYRVYTDDSFFEWLFAQRLP